MVDVSATIVAKSDQVNADDLMGVGHTITIRITRAKINPGEDQPWSLHFEGSDKVYRPSKGMRRIMAEAWGLESDNYVGQRLKLFRDPDVRFGKDPVGGIRIAAMTGITARKTFVVAVSKGQRRPFPVDQLPADGNDPRPQPKRAPAAPGEDSLVVSRAKAAAAKGTDAFRAWFNSDEGKDCRATGELTPEVLSDCKNIASGADHLGPKIAADEVSKALADADPFTASAVPTDAEIQAQIDADHRAAMAADEARMAGEG